MQIKDDVDMVAGIVSDAEVVAAFAEVDEVEGVQNCEIEQAGQPKVSGNKKALTGIFSVAGNIARAQKFVKIAAALTGAESDQFVVDLDAFLQGKGFNFDATIAGQFSLVFSGLMLGGALVAAYQEDVGSPPIDINFGDLERAHGQQEQT